MSSSSSPHQSSETLHAASLALQSLLARRKGLKPQRKPKNKRTSAAAAVVGNEELLLEDIDETTLKRRKKQQEIRVKQGIRRLTEDGIVGENEKIVRDRILKMRDERGGKVKKTKKKKKRVAEPEIEREDSD